MILFSYVRVTSYTVSWIFSKSIHLSIVLPAYPVRGPGGGVLEPDITYTVISQGAKKGWGTLILIIVE